MNNNADKIVTFDDLLGEKRRLEMLIVNQKNIVRHDLDLLRAEFKKEIRPAVEAATFIKKAITPERRKETFISAGTNIAIDVISSLVFGRSNFMFRLIVPRVLKAYTSRIWFKKTPLKLNNPNGSAMRSVG